MFYIVNTKLQTVRYVQTHYQTYSNACLMAIIHNNLGMLLTKCLHSGFYWS